MRLVCGRRSAHQQERRARGEEDRDLPGLAEVVGDPVLADDADDAGRDRGDDHEPGDSVVGGLDAAAVADRTSRRGEPDDVAPEVRPDRDERAQVERDVERLVEAIVLLEIRPLGGPRNEDQVTRGRDREELGQALHEPEHERLPVRQRVRVVGDAGEREHEGEPQRRPRDAVHEGAAHAVILRSGPAGPAGRKTTQIAPNR